MPITKGCIAATAARIVGRIPFPATQALGALLGRAIWIFGKRIKHVTQTNLSTCFPNLTPEARTALAKQSMIESGKTILESAALWTNSIDYGRQFIHHVHHEALLSDALQANSGLILILPHLGNWELTNHYITSKTDLLAMYQPAKLPEIETLMSHARNQCGTQMVPTSATGVKAVLRHLKKGGTTVILADQEPPKHSGLFASFYQTPALTQSLVPRLIQSTQAQALMIYTLRTQSPAAFEVHINEVHQKLYSKDLDEATLGLNQSIENCINHAVPQYQWGYKRFKQRPNPTDPPIYIY